MKAAGFAPPAGSARRCCRTTWTRFVDGHGTAGDLAELEAIAKMVKNPSHCGLGQTAANPIISNLERYPDLYEAA